MARVEGAQPEASFERETPAGSETLEIVELSASAARPTDGGGPGKSTQRS